MVQEGRGGDGYRRGWYRKGGVGTGIGGGDTGREGWGRV